MLWNFDAYKSNIEAKYLDIYFLMHQSTSLLKEKSTFNFLFAWTKKETEFFKIFLWIEGTNKWKIIYLSLITEKFQSFCRSLPTGPVSLANFAINLIWLEVHCKRIAALVLI